MRIHLKSPVGNGRDNDPADVVAVKRALEHLGLMQRPSYGLTGFIDRETDTVLRRFQRDRGLGVDGYARPGGPTERNLNGALAGAQPPRLDGRARTVPIADGVGRGEPNEPEDVRAVQQAMAALGRVRIDRTAPPNGVADRQLVEALEAFQRENGLKEDGIVLPGGPTQVALRAALDEHEGGEGPDAAADGVKVAGLPAALIPLLLGAARVGAQTAARRAATAPIRPQPGALPRIVPPLLDEPQPHSPGTDERDRWSRPHLPPDAGERDRWTRPEPPSDELRPEHENADPGLIPPDIEPLDRFDDSPETIDALVDKWIVMESRRGNDVTRQQLDEIRDYFKGVLTEVDKAFDAIGHTHGGRDGEGKDLKELYIPGIRSQGTKDSSYVDLALYNKETGRYIYIQSVDVRADGSMVPREEGQDTRLQENDKNAIILRIPKQKKGKPPVDLAPYRQKMIDAIRESFRPAPKGSGAL